MTRKKEPMNQKQLDDMKRLVRFADEDAPTLIKLMGRTVPETADVFISHHSDKSLSPEVVEKVIRSHNGIR